MIAFYLVAAIVFLILGVVWKVSDGLNFFLKCLFLGMMLWGTTCFIIHMVR